MNLQKELKFLKERIAELEEQANKGEHEFPRFDDPYWMIDDAGDLYESVYTIHRSDVYRNKVGNMYRTEEEAEFALEKAKVEGELRKLSRPFIWGEENWYLDMARGKNITISYDHYIIHQGTVYFESKDRVKEAIEVVGEERIKKYIFGVED